MFARSHVLVITFTISVLFFKRFFYEVLFVLSSLTFFIDIHILTSFTFMEKFGGRRQAKVALGFGVVWL